jgi:hypothetical protein
MNEETIQASQGYMTLNGKPLTNMDKIDNHMGVISHICTYGKLTTVERVNSIELQLGIIYALIATMDKLGEKVE